jgi:hypothetical protein
MLKAKYKRAKLAVQLWIARRRYDRLQKQLAEIQLHRQDFYKTARIAMVGIELREGALMCRISSAAIKKIELGMKLEQA